MFLRAYHRTKNGKPHTYFALVQSLRTARGPRQRIVAELGELSPDEQRRWERTALFHTRHESGRQLALPLEDPAAPLPDDPDVVRIRLGKTGWTNARAFGDVWLGLQLWRKLGLDQIVARHIPAGRETIPPALMVAIEVITRLCVVNGGATSEFALAEHGYRRTALEDLLGVPDEAVTKDRLYRTLDALLAAKTGIERDLKERLGELFELKFDLLLCDLTSSFFEGLADENELAARGYSRDHRSDCKQVILALIVTPDGFPVYHQVFAGNTQDAVALPQIIEALETHFGAARRVWVMDRGLATAANLDYLRARGQSFLVGTPRSQLKGFEAELCMRDWQQVRESVQIRSVQRDGAAYVLARSAPRRAKERAMRRRQRRGWQKDLRKLAARVAAGRLKNADKVLQQIGRLRERWPLAAPFADVEVQRDDKNRATAVTCRYDRLRFRAALSRDGAYLLLSDQTEWTAADLWNLYIQLTRAEDAFRAMKSHLLLRPMWHQLAQRVQAHVFICVLAYALWKALDHLLRNARVMTPIRKPDPQRPETSPQDRVMSPEVALRMMHDIQMGDVLLYTVDGRELRLRRIARPQPGQAELVAALGLCLPERICADQEITPTGLPPPATE